MTKSFDHCGQSSTFDQFFEFQPFTYTPGGIDLSEIRSPRMAKRLQMNAAAEGVTSAPKPAGGAQQGTTPSPSAGPLPPAAMAAMQPQMAFCVFPQVRK